MHRRLPNFLLALVIAAAWAVSNCSPVVASTGASTAPTVVAQAEPPPGEQPVGPDSSAVSPNSVPTAPADSTSSAPRDSISSAGLDSTSTVLPDSSATSAKVVPKQSALSDTLQFLPPPGSQTADPKAGGAAAPPKQRAGLFGLTPIVILIGIAALHYFVIKAVSD